MATGLAGCGGGDTQVPDSGRGPDLRVTELVSGLDHPWDVQPLDGDRLLISERDRARLSVWDGATLHPVPLPSGQVWVSGETGLMGLEVDPGFATNGRIYTCFGHPLPDGGHDVRVVAWRLGDDPGGHLGVTDEQPLVTGLPTSSGRHGGCRLLLARDGSLLVGTGDAAVGTNPEDLTSLGGKTLRLDPMTGAPWPGNPYADAADPAQRYLQTWGHRNVQGLAQRSDGTLWSVEHGPDRDDEVNLLVDGGDYGWNPVPAGGGEGYDESVPMTDQSLPGRQVEARWSSGYPTLATSGATWVQGSAWGAYDGTLAVATLKAGELLFMRFDRSGTFQGLDAPDELKDHGRLRSVTLAPDGALLVTTDNGGGDDVVLRVTPSS